MKRVAGALGAVALGEDRPEAIDEDSSGADLRRFGEEQAVDLLHLLLKHLAGGKDRLQLSGSLQRGEIPAELLRSRRSLTLLGDMP